MTAPLNYDKMPIQDKFIMLEELWENMSHNATANGFTPKWHLDILSSREKQVEDSELHFSNLEDVKKRLEKLV